MKYPFILYGANGYTAELIAELAVKHNVKPLLAGRSDKIIPLAQRLGLNYQVCPLDDTDKMADLLSKSDIFLNCAGPFMYTAKPAVKACLAHGVHYLDITGEHYVFEAMRALDDKAKEKKIMILSGVGFDVVPSDCLALHLKNRLPSATHLTLAFASIKGGMSRGTAKTTVLGMGAGGMIRQNGQLKPVPLVYKTNEIDFGPFKSMAVTIPWGDISTAYFSTGIPNIMVYTGVKQSIIDTMKWNDRLGPLLRTSFARKLATKAIEKRTEKVAGPDENRRNTAKCYFKGTVEDENGIKVEALLTTPEGYKLTALTAFEIVKEVMAGNFKIGYQTPATAYGPDFILKIDGCERTDVL